MAPVRLAPTGFPLALVTDEMLSKALQRADPDDAPSLKVNGLTGDVIQEELAEIAQDAASRLERVVAV